MTMLSKLTLAFALAITAITMIVPASARPGDAPYGAMKRALITETAGDAKSSDLMNG
jgi:hypothetical protein